MHISFGHAILCGFFALSFRRALGRIFYYLPVLMISGTVAGIAIGIASEMVIRRVKLI